MTSHPAQPSSAPHPSHHTKKRKKRSVSQTIDQVMTIKTHTESSKTELSSRGTRPFKVCRFFFSKLIFSHDCNDKKAQQFNSILSRVGVTWYTFKQKAPKFRVDWYKGAYFCKIVKFFGHYNRLKRQTLNGRLPPEDSSVFDDSVCVLIVMT